METFNIERTIENPIIKDKITFLQTSKETNGAYSLILIDLASGGGNADHYHDMIEEEFEAVKGNLTLIENGKVIVLKPGEKYRVGLNKVHAFHNKTNRRIQFKVKITPSSQKFEQFLQIMYGLARDGKTNRKGIPINIWDIAAVSFLSETHPPKGSFLARIGFIIRWFGKKAKKNGGLNRLIERYVEF
jgi:quercetin dioxygenase-like cupin family protein